MPWRAQRPCTAPGCPNLTNGGPCAEHRTQKERARGSASQRGYGKAWRTSIRPTFLAKHPVCDVPGCAKPATDVDHQPPREELVAIGVPDPDAEEYLHSKCHSHHSAKTAKQTGFGGKD